MRHSLKITATLAALTLAVTALAGCTATEQPPAAEKPAAAPAATPAQASPAPVQPAAVTTPEPEAEPTPRNCAADPTAEIIVPSLEDGETHISMTLEGELTDSGPATQASGTPRYDSDGHFATYTVKSGDTLFGIAERFCIEPQSFQIANQTISWQLQPGDLLILNPNPETPVEYTGW